jgi:internalin A
MCAAANILNRTHQRLLISILHDLGIALNFDDPAYSALRDINILNPEWVTGGVYALLNNRELKDQQGVLAMTQLSDFLDAKRYPERKQHLIIEIMEKFELCFAFEMGGKQYLIPELLPRQQPEPLEWDYSYNELRFEYHYDVLPSSVISRFITRLHDQIWQKTYWHTGVILEHDDNRALVKADLEDKKLRIWISGNDKGKRSLLAIVRKELDYIHKSISKIQVTEQVPYWGIVIPYADLLKLEKNGYKTYFIPSIEKEVDVVKLLDGIDADRSKSTVERKIDQLREMAEETKEKTREIHKEVVIENKMSPRQKRIVILLWVLITTVCLVAVFSFFPENSTLSNVIWGIISGIVLEAFLFSIPTIAKAVTK